MSDDHRFVSSTRLIALLTLASRVLGLARECAFGFYFGTSELLSAFRIAFMIPNLARRLFGEGALTAAFIPVFARELNEADPDRARRLAGGVWTWLAVTLAGIVAGLEIVLLAAHAVRPDATLWFTAIMLPFMLLICLTAFLGGVLNTLGRFAAPAAAPMILNAAILLGLFGGAEVAGNDGRRLVEIVCVAVVVSGFGQLGLQWWSMRRAGFRLAVNREWSTPAIRSVRRTMTPMLLGLSTVQINNLFDMLIAEWFVADGRGPAVLGYAHFFYQLPLGVFGIALATAVFPLLSRQAAAEDSAGFTRTVERGIRLSLFVMLPASVGLMLVGRPLVGGFLERGAFGNNGTWRVSCTLSCYAVALCAYSLQHILIRAFYSLSDAITPVRISAALVFFNIVLNLMMVRVLGETGVAISTALTAFIQVSLLWFCLRRRIQPLAHGEMGVSLWRTLMSTVVMAAGVWLVVGQGSPVSLSRFGGITQLGVAIPIGVVLLFGTAFLVKSSEARELLDIRRPIDV